MQLIRNHKDIYNKILKNLRDNSIQFNTINKTSDIDNYLII